MSLPLVLSGVSKPLDLLLSLFLALALSSAVMSESRSERLLPPPEQLVPGRSIISSELSVVKAVRSSQKGSDCFMRTGTLVK